MRMGQGPKRTVIPRQLLQADNDMVFWDIGPGDFRDEARTGGSKIFIAKHAIGAALDVDRVAGFYESLDCMGTHFICLP